MRAMGLSHRTGFIKTYIQPAIAAQLLEMTIPDKPRNNKQRYRNTLAARQWLAQHWIKS